MKRTTVAGISLVLVAVTWGAAFVIMKPAIVQQPFYDFLATRFTIATLAMILVRPQVLRLIDRDLVRKGVPLGVMLGLGYVTQTIALELTTAAITGFLTGLYLVLTPVIAWMVLKQKVSKKIVFAISLATLGLGVLSITGFTIELGQIWGIICAVLFAAHIVGLSVWSPGKNTYALTVLQLGTVAVVCWFGAFADGGYQPAPNQDVWFAIIFTAILSTAVAFFVQTWAQSIMDSSRVALILTTEVVFTAAISFGVGQEELSAKTLIGGGMMLIAMLIVEWPSRKERQLGADPLVH